MQHEKLSLIRAELKRRTPSELAEISLSLARLKTENKEMLSYLLFESHDPLAFAEKIKIEMDVFFDELSAHPYYATKNLRKIMRLIGKYSRFSKYPRGEAELFHHFVIRFLEKADTLGYHKPLQGIIFRALKKAKTLITKLHEDLRYDLGKEQSKLVAELESKIKKWDNEKLPLQMLLP